VRKDLETPFTALAATRSSLDFASCDRLAQIGESRIATCEIAIPKRALAGDRFDGRHAAGWLGPCFRCGSGAALFILSHRRGLAHARTSVLFSECSILKALCSRGALWRSREIRGERGLIDLLALYSYTPHPRATAARRRPPAQFGTSRTVPLSRSSATAADASANSYGRPVATLDTMSLGEGVAGIVKR